VPRESTAALRLPARWARLDCGGNVLAAQTGDGRLCLLFKTHLGWKDNFEGAFYCSAPLRREEIVAGGRQYISLPGLGVFEELYIRRSHGSQLFEVYFDLN
jgi:hypothetical protein